MVVVTAWKTGTSSVARATGKLFSFNHFLPPSKLAENLLPVRHDASDQILNNKNNQNQSVRAWWRGQARRLAISMQTRQGRTGREKRAAYTRQELGRGPGQ